MVIVAVIAAPSSPPQRTAKNLCKKRGPSPPSPPPIITENFPSPSSPTVNITTIIIAAIVAAVKTFVSHFADLLTIATGVSVAALVVFPEADDALIGFIRSLAPKKIDDLNDAMENGSSIFSAAW